MKQIIILASSLPLLAGCANSKTSASESSAGPSSEASSSEVSTSSETSSLAPAADWTAEQKSDMEAVFGTGHLLPFFALDTPVFSEYIGGVGIASGDKAAMVTTIHDALVTKNWAMGAVDSTDNSTFGYSSATANEYFYIEVSYNATDGFSIYAEYDYYAEAYPSDLFVSAFGATQAALFPAVTISANGYFETAWHMKGSDGCLSMYVGDDGKCAAYLTSYNASLKANGLTYNSTAGGYVTAALDLVVITSGDADYLQVSAYQLSE